MSRVGRRRIVQGAALAAFLVLYARTAYHGADVLDWPVHLVFRLDPLAALAEGMAGSPPDLLGAWLGALLLVAATALLGRFFCGWLCPMGTLLEYAGRGLRALFRRRGARARLPGATAPLLFSGLFAATLLGWPLLGFLDPLSILLRSLTLSLFPALDHGAKGLFALLFAWNPPVLGPAAEWGFETLSGTLLSLSRPAFLLAAATGALFAGLFALELLAPRFWCAHLCPLGALLGLCSRLSPLGRVKSAACGACRKCVALCPTGAADRDPADRGLCIQCSACADGCPNGAMALRRAWVERPVPSPAVRRALLASLAAGGAVALGVRARASEEQRDWDFLRPPGAKDEGEFNRRCVRCGACMRVCPRNALHPSFLEAGAAGLWSPRLVPRVGGCEYHCRLCGQVCPTGAIGYLEEGEKERFVIGIAVFDRDRCLPYRAGVGCMVCEEHCPTSPKAIEFEERETVTPEGERVRVKFPRVLESRCVGCGICEEKCPLPGASAIRVSREKPPGQGFGGYGAARSLPAGPGSAGLAGAGGGGPASAGGPSSQPA